MSLARERVRKSKRLKTKHLRGKFPSLNDKQIRALANQARLNLENRQWRIIRNNKKVLAKS